MSKMLSGRHLKYINDNFIYITSLLFVSWSMFILGNYQDWGGDYAQYITQSRNILWDRPWSHLMEGFPSIMPIYPTILAMISWIFDDSIYIYSLFNTVCWLLTSLIVYRTVNKLRSIKQKYIGKIIYTLILFNPYIISYQQSITPMFFYTLVVWSVLYLITFKDSEPNNNYKTLIFTLILLIVAGLTRTTFIALSLSIILYGIHRREFRYILITILSLILVLSCEYAISINHNQLTNFSVFVDFFNRSTVSTHSNSASSWLNYLQEFTRLLISYLSLLGESTLPLSNVDILNTIKYRYSTSSNAILIFHPFILPFVFFLYIGFKQLKSENKLLLVLYFFSHISLVSLFLQKHPIQRYVVPLLPFFVIFVTLGFVDFFKSYFHKTKILFSIFFAFLLISGFIFYEKSFRNPFRSNTLKPDLIQSANFIKSNCSDYDQIAFFKPRVFTYLIDSKELQDTSIIAIRDLDFFKNWISSNSVNVIILPKNLQSFNQLKLFQHALNNAKLSPIFQNESYCIFVKRLKQP